MKLPSEMLQLLQLALFGLLLECSAIEFKIGLITEVGLINSSLIDAAFTRRVNSNWRVLQAHTLSYVHVNVSWCSSQLAVRSICSHSGLSGLIAVGSCSLLDEVNSLSKSLQLPVIAVPNGLCDPLHLSKDFSVISGQSSDAFVSATKSAIPSDSTSVAILYDGLQVSTVLQKLQTRLTSAGLSSLTFQVDSTPNASVSADLVHHLSRLVKKKVFKLVLLASPHNALTVLKLAREAAVLQQNYFWLVLDTGLSKADVLSVTPANANVALLRGSVFAECTAAVTDVFPDCQLDWTRSVDARFVDAVEAMAKALNDSVSDVGFSPSNASCRPLQQWTWGSSAFNRLISIYNFDTYRGVISFNSSSRHLSSQGIEVVASYNHLRTSSVSMLRSAHFDTSSGVFSRLFRYKEVSLAFANTFMGFKNQTIMVCSPESVPHTIFRRTFPNKTVVLGGMIADVLQFLAKKLDFNFITKDSNDANWGSPRRDSIYFTGCVGELQRGEVDLAAGPFTRTSVRDAVVDFSAPLFQESNTILLPRPPRESKLWNVFTPFSIGLWLLIVATMLLAAVVTWLFAYFSPFTAYNMKIEYAIADEIWLQEYIWSIIGSFMQQGQDFYPFCMSARSALAFWWMFTVVIYASYTGDLTAHLTVTVTDYPIKSLQDLVSQTAIKPHVEVGTNLHTLLTQSTSGIYKQVADMLVELGPYDACPSVPRVSGQACLTDYTFLLAIAMKNCSDYYLAEELFNTATLGFMFPEDAFYADAFNFQMQKLHESGQIQRWFNVYWSSDTVCTVGKATEADSVNLEGAGGCFIVALSLYASGLVILLVELIWTKLAGRQPLDCVIY